MDYKITDLKHFYRSIDDTLRQIEFEIYLPINIDSDFYENFCITTKKEIGDKNSIYAHFDKGERLYFRFKETWKGSPIWEISVDLAKPTKKYGTTIDGWIGVDYDIITPDNFKEYFQIECHNPWVRNYYLKRGNIYKQLKINFNEQFYRMHCR